MRSALGPAAPLPLPAASTETADVGVGAVGVVAASVVVVGVPRVGLGQHAEEGCLHTQHNAECRNRA